jgi:hypothetical protein
MSDHHPQYSDEQIADAWVKRYAKDRPLILLLDSADKRVEGDQRNEAETFWAFEELSRLVKDDPTRAWAVILRVLESAQQNQEVLDNLAAGPLESLLVYHGIGIIEWVEAQAKSDLRFKELLLGVWGNAINEAVWARLQALFEDSAESRSS